ncbi:PLD nuclease N-terminal domain-containing protein [Pontibacter sp. H259]|uniref:PLD nuclease N-terminal domain-containing protein n=1 Tax=Pontibacter sp. H259 TaxID=3133421 RepID=UPI0030BC3570
MPETILFLNIPLSLTEAIIIILFLGMPVLLWLWAIIDLLRSNFADSVTKLIWLVVVAFIPFLGAILYLLIGRKQRVRTIN